MKRQVNNPIVPLWFHICISGIPLLTIYPYCPSTMIFCRLLSRSSTTSKSTFCQQVNIYVLQIYQTTKYVRSQWILHSWSCLLNTSFGPLLFCPHFYSLSFNLNKLPKYVVASLYAAQCRCATYMQALEFCVELEHSTTE